jgi:hypothetical protein
MGLSLQQAGDAAMMNLGGKRLDVGWIPGV